MAQARLTGDSEVGASGFTLDELHENGGGTSPHYLSDGKRPAAPVRISSDLKVGEFQITIPA